MASPKVLREWCRATCAGYSSVEVKDWSASFRSGLVFCAIIHKHRPDLIDFSSLSKYNAYHNNKLAFEVAETKLGIPMLLNAEDVVSVGPDGLAVLTYLFQFYCLFNRKSICPGTSKSHAAKNTSALKNLKSLTPLESTGEKSLPDTKPRVACNLCYKPVHLIQRQVVDGIIYHRTCFRCKRCRRSLLPCAYSKGEKANSLVCTHHVKHHRVAYSNQKDACGFLSLSGLAISSVPHYPTEREPQDGLVCQTPQTECKERETHSSVGLYSVVKKRSRQLSAGKDCSLEINGGNDVKQETGEDSENFLARVPEKRRQPVPAPRRRATSSGSGSAQNMSSPGAQGTADKTNESAPVATHLGTSPTRGSPRVKTNHPWLKIIHPGPWTQLPPAPALVHPLRSKSVTSLSGVWPKPKNSAPSPFKEEKKNETAQQKQTDDVEDTELTSDGKDEAVDSEVKEVNEPVSTDSDLDRSQVALSCADDLEVQTNAVSAEEAQSHSEAAVSASSIDSLSEADVPSPTETCNKNPTIPESETSAEHSCQSPAALGHGFPLIKRKVQTDQCVSTVDLQLQMGQVSKHLEALEEKGVELERDIRGCTNNKEEEKLLMDWFSLVHERQVLVRRDTELVYLIKQQELEQRHEDVEYQLRCLLNKPERQWTEEDRRQEQCLTEELVNIVEQRNQIISSQDEDLQRERQEDVCLDTMMKNKDFQRRKLKELKKSKGKSKTTSVFKTLNQKSESKQDKKS